MNLDVESVIRDLRKFVRRLRSVNAGARVVLSVSPVPLNATAVDRHVLTSTLLSKAVLRAACDVLERELDGVVYFPAYEIIVGPHTRGGYFAEDLRSVTEEGVEHVMRVFFRHFAPETAASPLPEEPERDEHRRHMAAVGELVRVLCDEDALTPE